MEWIYLTTVPDQLQAEMLVQALLDEAIHAVINPGDTSGFLGVSGNPCRIMVGDSQWGQASALLAEWQAEAERDVFAGGSDAST